MPEPRATASNIDPSSLDVEDGWNDMHEIPPDAAEN
jgi:hypothetical protein